MLWIIALLLVGVVAKIILFPGKINSHDKNILWVCIGVVILLLIGTGVVIFAFPDKVSASDKVPALYQAPPPPQGEKVNAYYYSTIWKTQIIPPAPRVERPVQQKNLLGKRLKQVIRRCMVINGEFAIVRIGNKDRVLVVYTPAKAKNALRGKEGKPFPWEVKLSGSFVIAEKFDLEKGILFRFRNETAWLEEFGFRKNKDQVRKFTITQSGGQNISQEQAQDLIKNYEEYIKPLGLILHKDQFGRALGVRVRRVREKDKAHQLGLRENDIITDINGTVLDGFSREKIEAIARRHKKSRRVSVRILRDGKIITLDFNAQ